MFGKVEELLIVLVIILVLFGAKKLPQLSRSIGESVREIRKGFSGDTSPAAHEAEPVKKSETRHGEAEAAASDKPA